MAFGGNTRDLGSFGEETDKITDLHGIAWKIHSQNMETASQLNYDAVSSMVTASGKVRRRHDVADLKKHLKILCHEIKKTISLAREVPDIVLIITFSYVLGF